MIVLYPDPILTHPAAEVTTFGPILETLVAGMFKIVGLAQGIGLAAPQIGAALRVAVVDVPTLGEKFVMVNPRITAFSEEQVLSEEGCLSLPGIAGIVPRASKITLYAQDEKGSPFEREIEGALACVVQHELDHLLGILFVDHLGPVKKDLLLTRYRKLLKKHTRQRNDR